MSDTLIMELIGVDAGATVAITGSILEQRDGYLADLKKISPETPAFVQTATARVSVAKALLKAVEASRVEVKEPILSIGRRIDEAAKDFSASLKAEVDRVERMIGEAVRKEREAKLAEEARIRAEQQAILQAELDRKAEIERQAQMAAREEERRQAEIQAKLDAATSKKQKDALTAKLEAEQALASARREEQAMAREQAEADSAADRQALVAQAEVIAAPILGGGSQVRAKWTATVVDQKLAFASVPECFEVKFSPSAFAAYCKLHVKGENPPVIPGLAITRDVRASIR